jgi:hypothetical protein
MGTLGGAQSTPLDANPRADLDELNPWVARAYQ